MTIIQKVNSFYHNSHKLGFFLSLALCCNVLGFMPTIPQPIIYILLLGCSIYSLTRKGDCNMLILLLLLYIPIELLLAQPLPLFRSWERFLMFVLLLISVSPMLNCLTLRDMRWQMLQMVLYTCVIIGVGSFGARFLGINYMIKNKYQLLNDDMVGLFGGLTTHSMLLGPISGIGAIFLCTLAFKTKRSIYWVGVFLCIMSVLFSASRSALFATLAGVIVALYKLSKTRRRFVKILVGISLLGLCTFPIWESATLGVITKQQKNIASGGQFSSRQKLWNDRIEEFKSNPILGVGFVAIGPNHINSVNKKTGVIEPGSSWLSILSMTGIIGTLILIPILFSSFLTVWYSNSTCSPLLVGLLTLLFVHMIAEGYIFSAGSFLCFSLWLIMGCANDQKYINKSE